MRRITSLMSQWTLESKSGEGLSFEYCKGGYFSNKDEYGLKVIGKTNQLQMSGKNLVDIQDGSGSVFIDVTAFAPKSTPIVLSGHLARDGGSKLSRLRLDYTVNGVKSYLFGSQVNGSGISTVAGTIPADATKIEVFTQFLNDGTGTLIYKNIQLEKGSAATAYEPYCGGKPIPNPEHPENIECVKSGTEIVCGGSSVTVPCDLYEGDIWYPASGKVERYNYKGTLKNVSWVGGPFGTNKDCYYVNYADFGGTPSNKVNGTLWCNYYGARYPSKDYSCNNTDGIYIRDSRALTTAEFKTLLTEINTKSPVIILYKLATPIMESYPPALLSSLPGTVNVTQEPMQLTATLSASMLVSRHKGGT